MILANATSISDLVETRPIAAGTVLDGAAPSWRSRVLVALIRMLPIRARTASAAAVQDFVHRHARRPASHEPAGLGPGVEVSLDGSSGWPVYETRPATGPDTGNYVFFLHGGGYVTEIARAHWRIIGDLTRRARVRCVVPIYPLAPRGTADAIVPGTGKLLHALVERAAPSRVTVLGNSAGAGLALAAAQWLRDSGGRQPDGLVLISPGLDATLSRPEQAAIAARDPLTAIPGTREGARLYAGALGPGHPYVSPLRGEMHGLAPMLVFSGTRDLLYPDSLELAAKARAAGVPVTLHLQRDQPHNYPGLPTPEGRAALAIIRRAVAGGWTVEMNLGRSDAEPRA